MMGASVICGENDEHAQWLAKPGKVAFLGMAAGRSEPYATPELAADYQFTAYEQQVVDDWSRAHIIGGPETVRAQLDALLERTGADELMIGNVVWPFEERVASFERLSGLFAVTPAS
jgi:alkanesulfonate monooxygenase SsuD/methylene tetrahydromethanopterin reductase-like flavin-dependent oxidoreductase (luciferase family)